MAVWYQELEDRAGVRLHRDKAQRFEMIINARRDEDGYNASMTAEEARRMVIWASEGNFHIKSNPTVVDVVKLLYVYRKRMEVEQGLRPIESTDDLVGFVKFEMAQAKDHRQRWNIMCHPSKYAGGAADTDQGQCEDLFKWACGRWPDFEEAAFQIRCGYAREIKSARLAMAGAIKKTVLTEDATDVVPF